MGNGNPLASIPKYGTSHLKADFDSLQLPLLPIMLNSGERPYHFRCEISVVKVNGEAQWVHAFGNYVNVFDTEPGSATFLRKKNEILDTVADQRGEAVAIQIKQCYDALYHAAAIDWKRIEPTKQIPEVCTTAIYEAAGEIKKDYLHVLRNLIVLDQEANTLSSRAGGTMEWNNCSEINKHMLLLGAIILKLEEHR